MCWTFDDARAHVKREVGGGTASKARELDRGFVPGNKSSRRQRESRNKCSGRTVYGACAHAVRTSFPSVGSGRRGLGGRLAPGAGSFEVVHRKS